MMWYYFVITGHLLTHTSAFNTTEHQNFSTTTTEPALQFTGKKLIAIVIDGLPASAMHSSKMSALHNIMRRGVSTTHMQPTTPSLEGPTTISLLTGMNPSSHGITNNLMKSNNITFSFRDLNSAIDEEFWWKDVHFIWDKLTDAGKKTAVFGTELCRNSLGVLCEEDWSLHQDGENFAETLDYVTYNMSENYLDAAFFFFKLPALTKNTRTCSEYVKNAEDNLKQLDNDVLWKLIDKHFGSLPLTDVINVLIFGNRAYWKVDQVLTSLTDKLNEDLAGKVNVVNDGHSAVFLDAYLTPGISLAKTYNELRSTSTQFSVYMKSNFPKEWHYKDGHFAAPLVIYSKNPIVLTMNKKNLESHAGCVGIEGYPGNDSRSFTLLVGAGPEFDENVKIKSVRITDVYPLICDLFNIDYGEIDGKYDEIAYMLLKTPHYGGGHAAVIVVVAAIIVITSVTMVILVILRRHRVEKEYAMCIPEQVTVSRPTVVSSHATDTV